MATDKNAQYNQLAWQLEQLKQEYYNQGGSGQLGGGNLLKEAEFKQGSTEVLGQIQKIQAQMAKMEPTLSGNPQDYIQAPINVQNYSDELTSLLNSGVPETDPRAQALISDIKQQTELVNNQSTYNDQLQALRGGAQDYIKSQKGLQTTQQNTDKQIADTEKQIAKLQTQKVVDSAAGKDTSAIEKQISTLQAQNQKEQVAYFNAKSESTPLGQQAAANAANTLEQSQVRNRTTAQITGQPAASTKGATTTGTTTTGTTTAGGTSTTSSGNNYVVNKGVLSYNNNPFTGEYQGKYYANGKLETADQIKADFAANYGAQAKFIASVPELSNLLTTAISQNWSSTKWQSEFANTQWAQQHPGDIGAAEIKRISSPSEYNTEYNAAQNRISTVADSLGIKLTPAQLGQQVTDINSPVPLDQNAVNSGQDMTNWLMQHPGATDLQIQQQMAKYGTIDPTTGPGGAIKQLSSNLQSLAQQYGVYGQFSPDGTSKSFDNYATQQVAAGANISDPAIATTAEQMYKTAAINTYKPFADQINAGMKVSDLASPYVNTLSSLLEVSPSDIQLGSASGYGSMISKAMMGDANGQPTNPYDFANQVRSQPEWLNTQNAHQTILGGVNQLIAKMGF